MFDELVEEIIRKEGLFVGLSCWFFFCWRRLGLVLWFEKSGFGKVIWFYVW